MSVHLPPHQRMLVESTIEQLIDLLDAADPDPDLEEEETDEDAGEQPEPPDYWETALVYGRNQALGPINVDPITGGLLVLPGYGE